MKFFNGNKAWSHKKNKIYKNEKVILFKTNKIIFTFLALLFVSLSFQLSAQIKITGKIVNKNNTPLEFAEVILLNKDSVGIKSELANEDGSFILSVQQGNYTLRIQQFSKLFFTKQILAETDVNLGTIQIENSSQELGAVNIEVKDKLIERKVDRVVFNVENSLRAVGGDALEALSVTPGVRVQNDKLTMIGKSSLAVMIDDKLIQLSGDDLANYLKSIPSDLIKSIEVISIPPSKYDAAGNSGYVNIKLKKGRKNAWNALLTSAYLQRTHGDGLASGNFNYNKNKLSISASVFGRKGAIHISENDDSYFPDGVWHTRNPFDVTYAVSNGRVGFDYQLSPKWIIGSQFMMNSNASVLTDNPYTFVQDYATEKRTRYLHTAIINNQHPLIGSWNLYNEFKIDSLGKKMTINLDYLHFGNNDERIYEGTSVIENPYSYKYFEGVNINEQDITNFSGKLDIEIPLKWINLSTGGKISTSTAQNNITSFNSGIVDSPVTEYELAKNKFQYMENVEAVYLSGSKKINKHWESQLGARVEATFTKTYAEKLNYPRKKNYIKLFPTAYVTYTVNDNSTVTLSYSRRIDRPRFGDLNPNMYYINAFQTIEGNAFLQPAFIDNMELVHTFKRLESKVYVSYENNLFSQIPVNDPATSMILYTNKNYIDIKKIGIAENYVFDKLAWWTSTNSADVNYTSSTITLISAEVLNGFNSTVSTSNDLNLNKNKTLLFNISYRYIFRNVWGIFTNLPQQSLSLGFQLLLLDKNLKISANASDAFRTEKQRSSSTVNGVYQFGNNYYDNQSFQLSVSYKFGNKTINVKQRETGNEEERNRTGG